MIPSKHFSAVIYFPSILHEYTLCTQANVYSHKVQTAAVPIVYSNEFSDQ